MLSSYLPLSERAVHLRGRILITPFHVNSRAPVSYAMKLEISITRDQLGPYLGSLLVLDQQAESRLSLISCSCTVIWLSFFTVTLRTGIKSGK